MALSNDTPIDTPKENIYGLDPFARAITKSIERMDAPEGLVLAINGPWGEGKSSEINLIRHLLRPAIENDELVLRRMKLEVTTHGFRATFRNWAAETTNYPRDVVEMALAHTIEPKAERAYRRGDFFDKRAKLMQEWADYCDPPELRQQADVLAAGQPHLS